ncbi:MAG: DNA-formamidopyrimidine glycosylase family protein [Bacteroidota bacterium]
MPELPDIIVYREALEQRTLGATLTSIRLGNPFLLRSVSPQPSEATGRNVVGLRRLGKRIVFQLEGDMFLVLHLMIAGRLHWKPSGAKIPGKIGLAAFDFTSGTLTLTEAGTKKRASLHIVAGEENLKALDRGGMDVETGTEMEFASRLTLENHTLKRSLTDPRLFSGIGNSYSDEILHRSKLSPLRLTRQMTNEEIGMLFRSIKEVFSEWTERLRKDAGNEFPEHVTAFRKEMAVHGKFNLPCPVCGTEVQRIVYAENECNYCPRCQTGGKLLADRAFSRLLKNDWPKTIEELEAGSGLKSVESQ